MKIRTFILINLICLGGVSAQESFQGVATYQMTPPGNSPVVTYTKYYRGNDYMTDSPQQKVKELYLSDQNARYWINNTMGKPIFNKASIDLEKEKALGFEVVPGIEIVNGHRCIRVSQERAIENKAMKMRIQSTQWLDTSYHIPFNYGCYKEVPYGLIVREENTSDMNGITFNTITDLVSVVEGKVDDALFFVPDEEEGFMHANVDANGNITLEGDTTGLFTKKLYPPMHSEILEAVDSAGFRAAVAKGKVVCMMTARWCGPCRELHPRLEAAAKKVGKGYRFIKFDIDQSRALATELNVHGIPVVILFEDGKEQRRLVSAIHSEEDLQRFIRP